METTLENNKTVLAGKIVSAFRFSHEVCGEGFYIADLAVKRLSNSVDRLPVMVSERLACVEADFTGQNVLITGQFRSFNRHEENTNRLMLFVFVREMEFINETVDESRNNQIFLDGYICKPPIYRKTPMGREITDLMLAVNRLYGKSDYVPCICWGRNARFAAGFAAGDRVQLIGRIQSRDYVKRFSGAEEEQRTVYEVSVINIVAAEE